MSLGSINVTPVRLVAHGSHEGETLGLRLGRKIREAVSDEPRKRVVETLVLAGHEEADQRGRRFSAVRVAQCFVEIADDSPRQFVQRIRSSLRRVCDSADAAGLLLQRDVEV